MRISDWSSDVCSSDLHVAGLDRRCRRARRAQVVGLRIGRILEAEAAARVAEAGAQHVLETIAGPECGHALQQFQQRLRPQFEHAMNQQVFARVQHREVATRSEEHTSELQSLMRIPSAVFCLKKKTRTRRK